MKKIFTFLFISITCKVVAQPCTSNTNSINFNGTSDYVYMPSSAALDLTTNVTVEAWINPASFGFNSAQGSIVCKHGWSNGEGGYVLRAGGQGELSFNIGGDSLGQPVSWKEVVSPTNVLTLNTWSHVAGTFNGDSLNLYINGVLVGTTLFTGAIASSSTYDLKIGRLSDNQPGVLRYWPGLIDEVRVWNKTLSAAEITANMNTQIDPAIQTGLVGYWRLNDGTGTTVADLSASGITGTLSGSGWSSLVPFSTGAPAAIITPSGNTTFCQGGSINLSASAGVGVFYLWSTGATTQSIPVSTAGTYTVTVSDANNCSAISSPVTVTVNPAPNVPTISFNGTLLTTSATTGIQWYLNGNTLFNQVNQNYTPTVNGSYTVIVTDNSGCTSSSAPYVVNTIGIEEINGLSDFTISYDGASETGLISLNLSSSLTADVSLSDLQGKQIFILLQKKLTSGKQIIPFECSNLQQGTYLVMLQNGMGRAIRKFIIIK